MNFYTHRENMQKNGRAVYKNIGTYQPEEDLSKAGMDFVRVPTPEEVWQQYAQSGLQNVHPRILATAADFDRIRAHLGEEPYASWLKEMQVRAETYLTADFIPFINANGDVATRKDYLGPCRDFKKKIQTLSMLWQLTREEKYAKGALAEMLHFAGYPTYYDEHFLNVAEACYTFALGYDWMYDYIPPEQKTILDEAVYYLCFNRAYYSMAKAKNFAGRENNWNQVCNSGIGVGAMAWLDVYPELCSELISFAIHNQPRSIAEVSPDGAYPEGATYWGYGMTYSSYFIASLQTLFHDDFGLCDIPGMKETVPFLFYCTSPEGIHATYGDCGLRGGRGTPQIYWFARQYQQKAFPWFYKMGHSDSEGGVYEMLWYTPDYKATPAEENFPLDMVFDGKENVSSFRNNWQTEDGLYGFFKAGNNQTNHGCLDIGQFLIHNFGMRWAMDLSSEFYHVPGYWDMKSETGRWIYYRKRAEGHNAILINPSDRPDQNHFAHCVLSEFGSSAKAGYAVCDMTDAYKEQAASARRAFALLHDRTACLVQDEIVCKAPSTVWWRMQTQADITLDGNKAILSQGGHTMTVTLQAPENAVFFTMDAVPLPTSPKTDRNSPNPGVHVLCAKWENVTETTLRAVFTFDGDTYLPSPRAIADWEAYLDE